MSFTFRCVIFWQQRVRPVQIFWKPSGQQWCCVWDWKLHWRQIWIEVKATIHVHVLLVRMAVKTLTHQYSFKKQKKDSPDLWQRALPWRRDFMILRLCSFINFWSPVGWPAFAFKRPKQSKSFILNLSFHLFPSHRNTSLSFEAKLWTKQDCVILFN